MAPILSLRGITKRFPGVLANDHIDLDINEGEIHALLGENGAGKTTLMNILYGLYQPQEGEIFFHGKRVHISSPVEAIHLGIGMVHQHFMLIPVFTVTENVILGTKSPRGIALDTRAASQRIRELSAQYNLDVDPDAYIWQLSVGMQQRVEILKALFRGARVLILDEPTAVLTPQETSDFIHILRGLAARGTAIIFISHKLNEVLSISDRVTVLRSGRVVKTFHTRDTNQEELATTMVGREVVLHVDLPQVTTGEPVLVVAGASALNDKRLPALNHITFEVKSGEILGLAGVDGNGQSELSEVLTGLRKLTRGKITVHGKELTNRDPLDFIRAGVAFVPQDRKKTGSIGDFSILENTILRSQSAHPFARSGLMSWSRARQHASQIVTAFDVRTPGTAVKVKALSGGNLQKLIFGREISREHSVLIAVQPTRGLDIAATEAVYRYLIQERQNGAAVLLISTELDEILTLSDRIAVIYEGELVGVMKSEEADIQKIGLWMAGVRTAADAVDNRLALESP